MNPYLQEIYVNDCYASKDFRIEFPAKEGETVRHLILTGKNGSGKTTILQALNREVYRQVYTPPYNESDESAQQLSSIIQVKIGDKNIVYTYFQSNRKLELSNESIDVIGNLFSNKNNFSSQNDINNLNDSINRNALYINQVEKQKKEKHIELSQTELNLKYLARNAQTATETQLIAGQARVAGLKQEIDRLDTQIESWTNMIIEWQNQIKSRNPIRFRLSAHFQNFLKIKKREQAYALGDNEIATAQQLSLWFSDLDKAFEQLFEEPGIRLKHVFKEGKFYFKLSDGREFDFEQLSDGYSSVLAIVAEIMLQIEAFNEGDSSKPNPPGIVVIDEIENHLHPSLQRTILPFLTTLFPTIQFIVATHSPAVIASISNATVYDLTTHTTEHDPLTGYSYNVLLKEYFGIPSEYPNEAAKRLEEAATLLAKTERTTEDFARLRVLADELNAMSPSLAYEIYLLLEKYNMTEKV